MTTNRRSFFKKLAALLGLATVTPHALVQAKEPASGLTMEMLDEMALKSIPNPAYTTAEYDIIVCCWNGNRWCASGNHIWVDNLDGIDPNRSEFDSALRWSPSTSFPGWKTLKDSD